MARPEATDQLGLVLKRIIHTMAKYYHHGLPIKFEKLDVNDRFWYMAGSKEDAWNFFMYCHPYRKPQPLMT